MSGVGGGREADGGDSGLGPSRDSEVTGSGPSPTKTSSSFLLSDPHSQGSLSLLQQPAVAGLEGKVMERAWSPRPRAFRPAKLGWLWEAEHALFIQATLFRSRWAPVSAASQELG